MKEKKQKWIVRKYLAGMPAKKIAAHLQIPLSTIYKVLLHYKTYGEIIKTNPIGRPKRNLNSRCKEVICNEWQKYQCGSVKLPKIMTEKGFSVSQRKIQQVMDEFKLTAPCPKRRGQRKYCSYSWTAG